MILIFAATGTSLRGAHLYRFSKFVCGLHYEVLLIYIYPMNGLYGISYSIIQDLLFLARLEGKGTSIPVSPGRGSMGTSSPTSILRNEN